MKKLLLLLVGAIVSLATHADVTIRFFNTNNWSQVNIWAWTTGEGGDWLAANGHSKSDGTKYSWPGPAMTYNSTNNCYQITFTNAPDNIIFSENGNNKIEVSYTVGADYDATSGIVVSHTYELWTNFRNNDTFKGYVLNTSNNYSYTLTFQGDESDTKAGIHIDGNWKGADNTSEYNGSKTETYNMSKDSEGDITFAKGLKGDVKFTYDVANKTLTLSGGSVEQGGSDSQTFYLLGDFNSWASKDSNYKFSTTDGVTYTYTLTSTITQGTNGWKINNGMWSDDSSGKGIGFGPASGNGNIGTPFGLSNKASAGNIKVGDLPAGTVITLVYSKTGTSTLLIKTEDTYTYGLYKSTGEKIGDFAGDPLKFTYNIASPLDANTEVNVRRIKNGSTVTTYRVNTALTYDGTNGGDKTLQPNGQPIILKKGLEGNVDFTLSVTDNVPTSVNISGGSIQSIGEREYTIYFYDKNNVGPDFYAHIWIGDGASATTVKPWGPDPAIKLVNTGKYIRRDGNNYPLYSLTFTWDKEPESVLIWNGNKSSEKKFTDDCNFVNNGYYTNGSNKTDNKPMVDLVPIEPGDTYLYMHFKEDLIFEAKGGENATAWCHVLNGNNFIGSSNRDDAHKMERVSAKYQIYRYKLTAEEFAQGNNVEFSFQNIDGSYATFRASNAENFNKDRWTRYIYATARRSINNEDVQYAIQTYLSWEEFRDIDSKGRPNLFMVGDEKGAIADLKWEPANARKYVNKDNACFYIPVTITGEKTTIFKISWMDVATVKENADPNFTNNSRDWATYDLGIVGIAARHKYPAGSVKTKDDGTLDCVVDGGIFSQDINCAVFGVNTSLAYNNFNQYNFVIEGKKLPAGNYYLVIDTHDACRTVTFTDFDPNPSVEVTEGEIYTIDLTPEQAQALHRHYNHLNCAAANGHIIMDRMNTCSGTINVHGSAGLDIEDSGYLIDYTVSMNGKDVVSYRGKPGSINLDYLPLTDENGIMVRAMYTDKERSEKKTDKGVVYRDGRKGTGLTFHSRQGEGVIEIPAADFPQPTATINNAKYAMSFAGVYGVLVDDISMGLETRYAVYGDLSFEIDDPTHDTSRRVQILHENHPIKSAYNTSVLEGWTPLVDDDESKYDFTNHSNDWSSMIIKKGAKVPVFIEQYTNISDQTLLQNATLKCNAIAVYPFLYEMNPTINVVAETAANVPAKAAARAALPDNLEGFDINGYTRTLPVEKSLEANGAISGIQCVAADVAADTEAEYYTISGVRVIGEPAPGLYIRRQGDKVTKVVVR